MRWFATPTYLCRKWLALRILRKRSFGGRFLEIGVGAGDFLIELARLGFEGVGIDLSEEAIKYTADKMGRLGAGIELRTQSFFALDEKFDIIFCFEVLEHFEDDSRALARMNDLLNPNGYLMLSVPARMKHWGPNDEWAGHVRRYERRELVEKAESSGFSTVSVDSFGVPLANITKIFYDRRVSKSMEKEARLERDERSERSWSVPLGRVSRVAVSLVSNRIVLFPFLLLQCLFLGIDLGTGYLALFRKTSQVPGAEKGGEIFQ